MSLEMSASRETVPSRTTLRESRTLFALKRSPLSRLWRLGLGALELRFEYAQAGSGWDVAASEVDALERLREAPGRLLQVAQGDLALVELPFRDHRLDGAVRQGAQLLGGRAGVVARGRHHHVRDHHQRRFTRLRLRSRVTEVVFVRRRPSGALGLFLCPMEEVRDRPRPVVLRDEGAHLARQLRLAGQLHSFGDVPADDLRAHLRRQAVVPVLALLVLAEVQRVLALADVVVVRADAREQGIGADRARRSVDQLADQDAVMVRARRLYDQ